MNAHCVNLSELLDVMLGPNAVDRWQSGDQSWRANHAQLPHWPHAQELSHYGWQGCEPLLCVLHEERSDSLQFRNALLLLVYFDSVFVYRELKALYPVAGHDQRPWFEEACRKILIRCFHSPRDRDHTRFRDISKKTLEGRLSTSPVLVELANTVHVKRGRPAVVHDMAVADGITTLDVAELAAGSGTPLALVASDRFLYLHFGETAANRVAFLSDGRVLQYEIDGIAFSATAGSVPGQYAAATPQLDALFGHPGLQRITMLAPEVELAAASGRHQVSFKEEDVFDPDPDIAHADIIRVANVLVESTHDHRGYFTRREILGAMANLGGLAGDGAYLVLNNFRRQIEYAGVWRKDASRDQWTRLPTPAGLPDDLDGIGDINIRHADGEETE